MLRQVYLPLYQGRISPEPIRDPDTGKLKSGPLIVKTDAGPGRLSKEAESMDFREQMSGLGVHILLSLPNGTSCTAEMDQLFEKFKPACSKSALRIATMMMKSRMDVRLAEKKAKINLGESSNEELDESDDDGKQKRRSVCNVSFSNLNLANLVNGWPEDPIELRPFDFHFTAEGIIKSWISVGFLPMTGNAVNDPKVRHELGDGGAPPEAAIRMKALSVEYRKTARVLTGMGFNGAVLDVKLPKAKKAVVYEDNEARIQHMIDNRCMNKAGGLFKTGLIVANCLAVNECNRRVAYMDMQKSEAAATKKADQTVETFNMAKKSYVEWVKQGRKADANGCPDLDKASSYAVVKFLLPKIDIKGELRLGNFGTMKKCNAWLGGIRRGMTWDEHMEAAVAERMASLGPCKFTLGGE